MDNEEFTLVVVTTTMIVKGDASRAEELMRQVSPRLCALYQDQPDVLSAYTMMSARAVQLEDLVRHTMMRETLDAGMAKLGQIIDLTPGREQRN